MEAFKLKLETHKTGLVTYLISKENGEEPRYRVQEEGTSNIHLLRKVNDQWSEHAAPGRKLDQEILEIIGERIELNDDESFSDYNEEEELRRMFPDEDSREGFDWTLGDS